MKKLLLIACMSATVAIPAFAAPDASTEMVEKPQTNATVTTAVHTSAPSATYGQLDALRTENAILTEQLKNQKLKKTLAEESQQPTVRSISQASSKGGQATADRGARVHFVGGTGQNLTATVQLSDGSRVVIRSGQKIAGLGLVKSIKVDEVLVQSGKDTYQVPFAVVSDSLSISGQQQPLPQPVPVVPALTGMN